jgi:FSR family fosmidomycin resistance protein-like MFS transporter
VSTAAPASVLSTPQRAPATVYSILGSISFCHLLNDMIQSLLPAIYPLLKSSLHLDFAQIGLIAFAMQLTSSLFQPVVGWFTDRRPTPYSLAMGMGFTLGALLLLSSASSFMSVLLGAATLGIGSAVFHPESSRVARMASGGKHGMAQSLFQVGGNAGSALGPLLAAYVVLPNGQKSLAWFAVVPMIAMLVLARVGAWYKAHVRGREKSQGAAQTGQHGLSPRTVAVSVAILLVLIFSKFFYLVSLQAYYTFYLIDRFHMSVQDAQLYLFLFLGATAVGTFIGGPVGDRIGRKYVIWGSIVGVLPFTLALPHADRLWTAVLSVIIGLVLSSAFSAILVYAQDLMPARIGTVSGMFFGFAFGMGGIGAALLGQLADRTSIAFVYQVCAFLPAIGLLTAFLPNLEFRRAPRRSE